jgi:hypothetical protein
MFARTAAGSSRPQKGLLYIGIPALSGLHEYRTVLTTKIISTTRLKGSTHLNIMIVKVRY